MKSVGERLFERACLFPETSVDAWGYAASAGIADVYEDDFALFLASMVTSAEKERKYGRNERAEVLLRILHEIENGEV